MRGLWQRLRTSGPLRGLRGVAVLAAVLVAIVAGWLAVSATSPLVAALLLSASVLVLPAVLLVVAGADLGWLRDRARRADDDAERLQHAEARVDVLEQVVADITRRPWDASLPPWSLPGLPEKPIVLVPTADYHFPEVVELARELQNRGAPTVLAIGDRHWDRTAEALTFHPDLDWRLLPPADELARQAGAVLTMKDWAAYDVLEVAKAAGVPTFTKVEGVNDYHDTDVREDLKRYPYRTADTVLCQGRNDAENLPGPDLPIVGSTRLERLWWAPPTRADQDLVVINLNFSYGVLPEARDTFLDSAVAACEAAGRRYVISLHQAEKARMAHPRAIPVGVSTLLHRATFLISRFSTAGYEAMARGVPFAYHNPHGEQVETYQDPQGAYDVTHSAAALEAVLRSGQEPGQAVRDRAADFFLRQVDVDDHRTSAQRGADVILDRLGH